jgi:small nuclear ribonucleoprotein E
MRCLLTSKPFLSLFWNFRKNRCYFCFHCFLQKKTRVRIWLYEDTRLQIEGQIIGFDEYMNMVLEDAVEIDSKKNKVEEVGRILLKGDSITMIQEAQPVRPIPQEEGGQ